MAAPKNAPRVPRGEVGSYCVWAKNGRKPHFHHPDREHAETEAKRLVDAGAFGGAVATFESLWRIAIHLDQLSIVNVRTESAFDRLKVSAMPVTCELHTVGVKAGARPGTPNPYPAYPEPVLKATAALKRWRFEG